MDPETSLIVFQGKGIRRTWHNREWFFSIIDIVTVLTGSSIPRRYWSDLKIKLKDEGFELYEKIVRLKRENLRDHMNDLELIFSMLGEAATTEITRNKNAQGFDEGKNAAQEGGAVAGRARRDLETKSGRMVVTSGNYIEHPEAVNRLEKKKSKQEY